MNDEIRNLLGRAEEALVTIRDFNKKVPLTRILRCACRDMSLVPQQISGGEDWFTIYREYWKKQVEAEVSKYIKLRKHQELLNSFRHFLKGTNLMVLDNVVSEANPDGVPLPEAFALSFLLTFYTAVFVNDLNTYLRPILIDGEFFKKENRAEYTGAYNDFMKIEEDIRKFDSKLAPSDGLGKDYAQVRDEVAAVPIKRRKIQLVLDDISHEAGEIIKRAHNSMVSFINILNGILKKEAGSKYDTVANFDKLAGKNPEVFITGVVESIEQFHQALQTLKDIDVLGTL